MAVRWTSRDAARLAPLVVSEYGATCWLCGKPIDLALPRTHRLGLTLDHVIARVNGGTNELANLRPAHSECNKRRGARSVRKTRRMRRGAAWPGIGGKK